MQKVVLAYIQRYYWYLINQIIKYLMIIHSREEGKVNVHFMNVLLKNTDTVISLIGYLRIIYRFDGVEIK